MDTYCLVDVENVRTGLTIKLLSSRGPQSGQEQIPAVGTEQHQ